MLRHCLCCHDTLLRHISRAEVYWYCPHCRQAMPEQHSEKALSGFSVTAEIEMIDTYESIHALKGIQ